MQLTSFDGKIIHVHVWDEVATPVGTVPIVHGMAEHGGKYEAVAKRLNSLGYVVYADDHRGHGLTDPDTLGYAAGDMFADTVADEALIAKTLKEKYPSVKHILLGHSYGSFLSQKFISLHADLIDGAILYASSYKKDAEVLSGLVVAFCGKLFKGADKQGKLIERLSFGAYAQKFDDRQWLSTDNDYNRSYYMDKLCGFTCSNNFYLCFFKGLLSLYTKKYAAGLHKDMPLLLISGAEDPVGNMGKGVEKLCRYYESRGMTHVRLHLIGGSRHVCLGEKEHREEFVSTVLDFIEKVPHK